MIKSLHFVAAMAAATGFATSQNAPIYFHQLWQIQSQDTLRIVPIEELEGERPSALAIDPGGAKFELWTFLNNDLSTRFLLDQRYVSTYTPVAEVRIATEDPYDVVPRTRADRPFNVMVITNGLLPDDTPDTPLASRRVTVMRHVQSYGPEGTGENLDRSQATLLVQSLLSENDNHLFQYSINSVPGADRTQVRGEERFSVFSLEHYEGEYKVDPSQLASLTMQVWPVARGIITGIKAGDLLRFETPQITFTLKDLYPDSRTYAQIYPGAPSLGTEGKVVSGSGLVIYDSVPHDRTLVLNDWDTLIDQDGQWTLELLTATPFGIDRLAHVSFNVNRSIQIQGTVTTSE